VSRTTGRECSEGDCMWLAPKVGAPSATSDRKPSDYECAAKTSEWPDCPRAIRWRLEMAEQLGDALADAITAYDVARISAALVAWHAARGAK